MTHDPDPREAALDWLVRTNDPDFQGWDEFTAWLEEHPANAEAYQGLAASEADMRPFVERVPVVHRQPAPDRRRFAMVAGVAAVAAAATAVIAPRMMPED